MSTWNPADKSATITLSGGNLTAAVTTNVSQSVRSTTSKNAGTVYVELTANSVNGDFAVGIANATEALNISAGIGGDANALGFYPVSPPQFTFINGVALNGGTAASSAGEVIGMAINFTAGKIFIQTSKMIAAGTPWNNSATDNPSTDTGGQPFTGLNAGPYFLIFNSDILGASCTVNFGASPFVRSVPTGYTAWDATGGSIASAAGSSAAAGSGISTVLSPGTSAGGSSAQAIGSQVAFGMAFSGGAASVQGIGGNLAPQVAVQGAFPPPTPPTLKIIPSYLYEQYADDENLQAFVDSFNGLSQEYLDWLNAVNLPIYTGDMIAGDLLDWVAQGLYGIKRPVVSFSQFDVIGPFNTYQLNTLGFNVQKNVGSSTLFTVTDDIFKRVITWNFYKGDGSQTTINWLKRRIMRFLRGTNGADPGIDNTYQVSIVMTGPQAMKISLINAGLYPMTYAPILQALILANLLPLPFQFTYSVVIV
jgi:hypothetical protein